MDYKKLRKCVEDSTKDSNTAIPPVSPVSLSPDFKIFEATSMRTEKLEICFQSNKHLLNQNVHFLLGGIFAQRQRYDTEADLKTFWFFNNEEINENMFITVSHKQLVKQKKKLEYEHNMKQTKCKT